MGRSQNVWAWALETRVKDQSLRVNIQDRSCGFQGFRYGVRPHLNKEGRGRFDWQNSVSCRAGAPRGQQQPSSWNPKGRSFLHLKAEKLSKADLTNTRAAENLGWPEFNHSAIYKSLAKGWPSDATCFGNSLTQERTGHYFGR